MPKNASKSNAPKDAHEPEATVPAALQTIPRKTKAALIRDLVSAPGGASLTLLMTATGWQAHTLRAAMTGLRKSGLSIERYSDGNGTIYRAVPVAEERQKVLTPNDGGQSAEVVL